MTVLFYKLCFGIAFICYRLSVGVAYPQPQIHVIGGDQKQEVVQMVSFYADLLGLGPQISILVSYHSDLPKGVAGYTMFKAYSGENPVMQAYIRIDIEQSATVQRLTLAHEMVHVKQFVTGELVHCGTKGYRWKGQLYSQIHLIPYLRRQWEREAIRKQYALYKQFRQGKMDQEIKQTHPHHLAISAEE